MLTPYVNRFWSAALLTCALVVGMAGVAHSDPRMWTDTLGNDRNGIKIRQGHHIEWQRASYRNSEGYTLVAWSDCRTGNRDIYGQLVSPTGAQLWGATGKRIVTFPYRQEDPEVVAVDGGWIIAWIEFRLDSTGDVFAQKLDNNGNPMWLNGWGDYTGVVVDSFVCYDTSGTCQSMVNETTLRAVHDGAGGAIIAWEDNRRGDPGDIFAQRVNQDGQTVFGGPGGHSPLHVTYLPGDQKGITADAGDNGSMLVAWYDKRNSDNQDIYAAKITTDGQTPWGDNGIVVCGATGLQTSPKLCPDGSGGCYIAWIDERNPSDDVYMQRMNASGAPQFATDGIPVCDLPFNQQDVRVAASMNGGNQDGCLVIWEDMRVNGDRKEVYAQKVSGSGSMLWQAEGLKICGDADAGGTGNTRDGARLVSDFNGGMVCSWEDTRDSDNDLLNCDLYAARVLANGTLAGGSWGGACGEIVGTGPRAQNAPLLRGDAGTGITIFYDDIRTGSQTLRYNKVDIASGNLLWTLGVDTVIVGGLDNDASDPHTVAMANAHCGVVWKDNRTSGAGALYYQVVDSLGRMLRPINGDTLVPDNSGGTQLSQENHDVCPDGSGGFFVSFEDNRTGTKRIRLTRVNNLGDLACSRAGEIVYEDAQSSDQLHAYCAPDGVGGCYVAWSNYNLDYLIDVWVQRLNANCQPVWPQAVRLTNTPDDDIMFGLVSDPDTSCTAVWKSGIFGDYNITGAKVHADGSVIIDSVCYAPGEQDNPAILADGQGGAYFAWADKRLQWRDRDIYAQHFDAQGHELWQHFGVPVIVDTLLQDKPALALDGANHLTIVWEDFRDGVSLDLWSQKLDPSGNRMWSTLGRPVCLARGDQTECTLHPEWGNGTWAAWTDSRVPFTDIYGSHWASDGSLSNVWWNADSGGVITDYYQHQKSPSIADDGIGGIYCAWEDQRASGKEPLVNIWMNRVNDFTAIQINSVPTAAVPTKAELYQNYPNPFNPSTRIEFSIPATQKVTVDVFNTLGQKVGTLVDKVMVAGKYEILFENQRLASGMYFYRLKTNNFVDVKKMILMK
jgi:hypothetical protein